MSRHPDNPYKHPHLAVAWERGLEAQLHHDMTHQPSEQGNQRSVQVSEVLEALMKFRSQERLFISAEGYLTNEEGTVGFFIPQQPTSRETPLHPLRRFERASFRKFKKERELATTQADGGALARTAHRRGFLQAIEVVLDRAHALSTRAHVAAKGGHPDGDSTAYRKALSDLIGDLEE